MDKGVINVYKASLERKPWRGTNVFMFVIYSFPHSDRGRGVRTREPIDQIITGTKINGFTITLVRYLTKIEVQNI